MAKHSPANPANPRDFTVEHIRDSNGHRTHTVITHMPTGEALVDAETYEGHDDDTLMLLAMDEAPPDPHSGLLPTDDAFIRAALRDLGVALIDEIEDPAPEAWRTALLEFHWQEADTAAHVAQMQLPGETIGETIDRAIRINTGRRPN